MSELDIPKYSIDTYLQCTNIEHLHICDEYKKEYYGPTIITAVGLLSDGTLIVAKRIYTYVDGNLTYGDGFTIHKILK